MQAPWNFNANQYEPNQGGMGIHPPAQKIPFTITNTEIKETKDSTPQNVKAYLSIEYTSPIGVVRNIYNIRNDNPKTVEIAYGQLSALCRAVGVFQIDGMNECAALRGAKGLMDIGYQKDEQPDPAFPDRKGYTELKRVYDLAGNDPSKPNQAQQGQAGGGFTQQPQGQQQPQGGPTPMTQQPGGWGQPNAQQPQTQQQPNVQQQQPNPAGGAWQPGGQQAGGAAPPWGPR